MERPLRATDDTDVMTTHFPAGNFGLLPINWFLIRGPEPILVDTGMPIEREEFLSTLWSLVEPQDLRWILLTHDDNDHAGNLRQVMAAAPDARVVTNFIAFARMADSWEVPPNRLRFLNPGETLTIGDREFTAIRPPIYDSPATTAYFDGKTGTLFAADSFGAFIPRPAEDVNDLPAAAYIEGLQTFQRALSPWVSLVDQRKFDAQLDAIRRLEPTTILSGHGPVARKRTEPLLQALSALPSMTPFVGPDQQALEAMLANVEAGVAPVA